MTIFKKEGILLVGEYPTPILEKLHALFTEWWDEHHEHKALLKLGDKYYFFSEAKASDEGTIFVSNETIAIYVQSEDR